MLVLQLPPLRERQGDLGQLVDHLLAQVNRDLADQPGFIQKELSPGARNLLIRQSWPGNVRQLHNALMRAGVWTTDRTISREDVQAELRDLEASTGDGILSRPLGGDFDIQGVIGEVVGHYFDRALQQGEGVKASAAELTGFKHYQTFTNWLERYDRWITYGKK